MARQYGAPPDDPRQKKGPGYSDRRRDQEPKPREPDPSPPAKVVMDFHKNAPVDRRAEDIHHTLGPGQNQASPGPHNHRGGDSVLLLEGITFTGSKGGNAALQSVINALVLLGAKDQTT